MKIFFNTLLIVLILLAISSGITKILLMQQEVDFFGRFGFTNPLLIVFGSIQLLAGIMMAIPKTRIIGAIIVAITFLISATILFMDNNIPFAVVTLVFVIMLGYVVRQSLNSTPKTS